MRLTDPLRILFLGNTTIDWIITAALLVGSVVLLYCARYLAVRRFRRTAATNATRSDDYALTFLYRTKFFFVLAIALAIAHSHLALSARVDRRIEYVIIVAVGLQAIIWVNALAHYLVMAYMRRNADDGASITTMTALGYLGRLVLWFVIVLAVLANLGVRPVGLITGLGVSGIAIALAVQNILGDLFGALSIVLDKPFVVGDSIAVDGFEGTVENIGLKTTRLRSTAGEQIIISNADLLKSRIRNYKRMAERRVQFSVFAEYATPPTIVATLPSELESIVAAQHNVRFDRAHFKRFAETGLEFETVYYVTTADYRTFMDAQQAINLAVLRRFRGTKINFAAERPTVAVTLGGGAAPNGLVAGAARGEQ
jgi:small-conductance mechanosensitive channel